MELLIVGIVTWLLFSKRLPTMTQQRRMVLSEKRSDESEIILLKVAVSVFVAGLWYLVWNSR